MVQFSIRKHLTLVLSLLLLTGCIRGPKKSKVDQINESADFRALETHGSSKEGMLSGEWKIPKEKLYNFSVCLQSRSTNAKLPQGLEFYIETSDKNKYLSTTDLAGCLHWEEPLSFNYSSQSKYIVLNRTVTGKSLYKGSVELNIAINPWSTYRAESGNEVIDLAFNQIPEHLLVRDEKLKISLLSGASTQPVDLEIGSSLQFNIHRVRDTVTGKEVRLTLRMKPYVELFDRNSKTIKQEFRHGQFKVFYQLVANYLGEGGVKSLILTPDLEAKDVKILKNGELSVQTRTVLNRQITQGTVQLALKIVPLHEPFPMNNYEGLHEIGSFDSLYGNHSPPQIEGIYSENKFDYTKFLKSVSNFEDLKKNLEAKDLKPVEYSEMSVRFIRVAPGETSTHRTILFRVTTQVTDSITGAPLRYQKFKIKKFNDGSIQDVVSNGNGFIKWVDSISHVFYSKERYFFPRVDVTHISSGAVSTLNMVVNPWDEGWTFGADLNENRDFYMSRQAEPRRPSRFMIDAFRYQTIRFRYVIDEFMTLNVKKAVVMAMDPLVQRDTITKGRAFEHLRDGIYLVKIALVKHFIDPFKNGVNLFRDLDTGEHHLYAVKDGKDYEKGEYYTIIQKLLRVQAGRITTPLEFSMRDLRMMSIRNNIMVQIELIDERKLLKDNILEAKINQLSAEHTLVNSMTEEKKEEYYKSLEDKINNERSELKTVLTEQLDALKLERSQISDVFAQRDQVFQDLETELNDDKSAIERIAKKREVMDLPKKELDKYIENIRSQYDKMDNYLEKYWDSWKNLYEEKVAGTGFHPTSLSYMAAMQQFVNNLSVESTGSVGTQLGINVDDYERLFTNDYMVNPAAPYLDLNYYVYKGEEAGLSRRTFIGPCTLIANDNLSELRPTDNIDEKTGRCERIDCSQTLFYPPRVIADNSEYEGSEYHGSLKPFAGKHVDDLIPEFIKKENIYYRQMQAQSQVGNFLQKFNLEFVSLVDEMPKIYKPGCKFTVSRKTVDPNTGVEKIVEEFDPMQVGELCLENLPDVKGQRNITKVKDFIRDLNYSKLNRREDAESQLDEALSGSIAPISRDENDLYNYFYIKTAESEALKVPEKIDTLSEHQDFAMKLWEESMLGSTIQNMGPGGDSQVVSKYSQFIYKFSYGNYVSDLNESDLKRWLVLGNKSMGLVDAVRLCRFVSNRVSEKLKQNQLIEDQKVSEQLMVNHCLSKIEFDEKTGVAKNKILPVNQRWIIKQTGAYKHKSGKNMNINVGIDFGMNKYQGREEQNVLGINWSALMGKAGTKATGGAKKGAEAVSQLSKFARIGAKASQFIPVLGEMIDSFFSVVINQKVGAAVEGHTKSEATSVSSLTFLVMQKAEMEIDLLKHQKCITSQFTPDFISYMLSVDEMGWSKDIENKPNLVGQSLSRGIMVCGDVTDTPESVIEDYYYFTQHFTAGDMLDEGNLLNHVWLLALRGKRDFATFINTIKAKPVGVKGEVISDKEEYALTKLTESYLQILPTFPGMYAPAE